MEIAGNIIPIIIVLLSFFWAIPVVRILQACLVEKSMDARLGLAALGVHLTAAVTLWSVNQFLILLIYLSVTTLLWMISPVINRISETAALRRMKEEDMERYQRLLAMDPRNAAAHAAIADIHLEQGRYDEAIAGYERAIEICPELARAERFKLRHAVEMRERRGRRGAAAGADSTRGLLVLGEIAMSTEAPPPAARVAALPPAVAETPEPETASEHPEPQPVTDPEEQQRQAEVWRWLNDLEKDR